MKINTKAEQAVGIERLQELFIWRPEYGLLLHRTAKGGGCSKVFALQPAGSANKRGYLVVKVGGRHFFAHRVAFAMHHGRWPDGDIDHIDRSPLNNRPENLRVATRADNVRNAGLRADNKSGIKGVHWYKQTGKWRAQIVFDGKNRNLGYYDDTETAALVRRIAEHAYFGGIHALQEPAQAA